MGREDADMAQALAGRLELARRFWPLLLHEIPCSLSQWKPLPRKLGPEHSIPGWQSSGTMPSLAMGGASIRLHGGDPWQMESKRARQHIDG